MISFLLPSRFYDVGRGVRGLTFENPDITTDSSRFNQTIRATLNIA